MWVGWLLDRSRWYGRNLVLEIMNEPNGQLWPQQAPSPTADPYAPGEVTVGAHVAEMIATARAVSADRGHPIGLAGAALSHPARPNDPPLPTPQTARPPTPHA